VKELENIDITDSPEELICYSYDSSYVKETKPALVAWPKNAEEVSRLVKFAFTRDLSIVPRGAGTAMTGSSVPIDDKTLVISLEKMKKLLDINTKNMTALVEPGILNGTLQRELYCLGFFYPPDPSSLNFCTIGGNVATNAGGPRAIKYGVTRDYIMELECVLPDGTIINCGGRTHKRVVGYDLKNLLIGSEGTLAIVTKIRLRMLPLPEDVATLLVSFTDIQKSAEAIDKIIASKIIPRTLEFMDRNSIMAVEQYKPHGLPMDAEALLIIEIDGYADLIKKEAEKIAHICNSLGGNVVLAADAFSREQIWSARRAISPALYHMKPYKINEDIVIPRDKIPQMISIINRISVEKSIQIICFGHAGDGNIHVNIMTDDKEGQRDKINEVIRVIFENAVKLGGSISGEHGIGITKAPYLDMELSKRQIYIMKQIKQIFDPQNRLNPSKIFA